MGVERMVCLRLSTCVYLIKSWSRIPDLSLTLRHPKRAFMQRAIELEMRLAYHDRILKTLPADMQAPESQTIAEQAPGPNFEYDDPGLPFFEKCIMTEYIYYSKTAPR